MNKSKEKIGSGSGFVHQVVSRGDQKAISLFLQKQELKAKEQELLKKEEALEKRESFNPGPLLHFAKSKVVGAVIRVATTAARNIWQNGHAFIEVETVEYNNSSQSLVFLGKVVVVSTEEHTVFPCTIFYPSHRVTVGMDAFMALAEETDDKLFSILYKDGEEERIILDYIKTQEAKAPSLLSIVPKRVGKRNAN